MLEQRTVPRWSACLGPVVCRVCLGEGAVGEKPRVLAGPQDEGQVRGQVMNHWTSVVYLNLVRLKSGSSVPGAFLLMLSVTWQL